MTSKRIKDKRDPELWVVGDTYYYRGRPKSGGAVVERSLGVKVPERGNALKAKNNLLIELRGLDPKQREYLFRDIAAAVMSEYDRKIEAAPSDAFKNKIRNTRAQVANYLGIAALKTKPGEFRKGYLLEHFELYPLRTITQDAWETYCDEQLQKRNRLLKYDARFLKQALLRAQRTGKLVAIPELPVPNAKRRVKVRRVLAPAEIQALYAKATGILKPLILIMYKMGCRPAEATLLTWDRVDFEKNTIHLRDEDVKAGPRTIEMNPQVRAMLLERKLKSKGAFCFPARGEVDQPVRRYHKQWKRLLAQVIEAGMTSLSDMPDPYCLRHTFLTESARRVKAGKESLVEVTQYAGTSIREFEDNYLHMTHEDTKGVASIMDVGGAI